MAEKKKTPRKLPPWLMQEEAEGKPKGKGKPTPKKRNGKC